MTRVEFVDETTGGGRRVAWGMEILEERLSVRELIRRRVFQEVAEFAARRSTTFAGLVAPMGSRRAAEGYVVEPGRRVDAEEQYARAVAAFAGNGFVVLVGDRQFGSLDEEVELAAGTEVTFLRLVPLVGG